MHVVIAGGSGFLGTRLTKALVARGDSVTILTRRPGSPEPGPVREAVWQADGTADASLVSIVEGADAVVNLAGAGIADRRWTTARKRLLKDSRILSTRSLVGGIEAASRKPGVVVQGSAVGYYGATVDDQVLDESAPPGRDFLGRLCVDWERESQAVADVGCRLVLLRTGLALADDDGALPVMKLPFLFFVGGPIASGRQYFPWIHIDDWVAMTLWAIDSESVSGPINGTAPTPVTNAEFSKALGRALHRPSWLPAPAFALRLIVGEFADEGLVRGQRVVPARAEQLGYAFRYAEVDAALSGIYGRPAARRTL
jgi:uncharacterized protein (TIGR01777 family)